jgi:hypothetical protein
MPFHSYEDDLYKSLVEKMAPVQSNFVEPAEPPPKTTTELQIAAAEKPINYEPIRFPYLPFTVEIPNN